MDTECRRFENDSSVPSNAEESEPMECTNGDGLSIALQQLRALAHQNSFTIRMMVIACSVLSHISYRTLVNAMLLLYKHVHWPRVTHSDCAVLLE